MSSNFSVAQCTRVGENCQSTCKLNTSECTRDHVLPPLQWHNLFKGSILMLSAMNLCTHVHTTFTWQDANLTTPLHLAALNGWVECIDVLISHGHTVDCRDAQGWPPLLYAHFQDHHDCVLALMKAQPKQVRNKSFSNSSLSHSRITVSYMCRVFESVRIKY